MIVPQFLLGPKHLYPGVNTPLDLEVIQRNEMNEKRKRFSNLQWRNPWEYHGEPVKAFVTHGQWQVPCICGNCPLVSVEWKIARCLECAAIFTPPMLVIPPFADEIERVLVKRPDLWTRNWVPGETIAELEAENTAHGVA